MHALKGTLEEVVRGEASWCFVHGDALHVLRDLPDGCVSAFVTDPPYSSGGAFRGDRVKETTAKYVSTHSANKEIPAFEGDVRDQRSFTLWTALWSSEAWRAGADGCHLVAFSDWRQLPSLCDAVQAGGWSWRGIKTEAGGLVVDPFVGSGSTCIAALRNGRRVVGIEINEEWAELARERVRADLSGSDYLSRASGQRALFG